MAEISESELEELTARLDGRVHRPRRGGHGQHGRGAGGDGTAGRVEMSGPRVRAGSGAMWGAVNGRAQQAGMLGLAGTAPDVGVAGYTFGGGVGLAGPRTLPRPAQDTFGPCDASRLAQIHLDPPAAVPAVGQGLWLDDSAARSAMAILGAAGAGEDSALAEIELRHVGARSADAGVPGAMTAAPGAFVLHATGPAPDDRARAAVLEALSQVTRAAASSMTGRECAAFRDGQTDALNAYDPVTGQRLRQITAEIDPAAVIRPARRLYP